MTRSPADRDAHLAGRRVLVVEDDPTVREVAGSYLAAAGFRVSVESDGRAALDSVRRTPPDLVVLDRMLPGADGTEVCRALRAAGSTIPILMLTALDSPEDRIAGLEAGADDYLAKPFSPRELVLRVQSILRRSIDELEPDAPYTAGAYRVDPGAREIRDGERVLPLSTREFELMAFLVRHPRQAFSREQLLREVWGWEYGDLSTVTVTVRRLREKIEPDPAAPTVLATVWGVGYRLDV